MVEAAIARLDQEFGLFDASPILLNAALGGAGRDFANAVALVESELEPPDMLQQPQGDRTRVRPPTRDGAGGPRVLDLDIVAWSGGKWRSRGLTIPHKSAIEREASSSARSPRSRPDWRARTADLTAHHFAHRLAHRRPRG